MKRIFSYGLCLVLLLSIAASLFSVGAAPSSTKITTTPTGYTSASDVKYVLSGKYIANWGARGENCVFLSTYAQNFYTGDTVYDTLSNVAGGTSQSNASSSRLYNELQDLMESAHTFYTYYDGNQNVREYYKYTDCVSSDTSKVALLYRGGLETSTWNSGSIWNQEHMWPKSKLSTSQQIGDIMHLRPSNPSENSSRGNTAYGEGSGYYDPGVSVRGDCARMALYMYVRWGATSTMWGTGGVIQNLSVLLKWMEEDPVDTWEMGRNDAVQSVTGTRNVFVDYPEYAWLLFGEDVPNTMVTPSGEAKGMSGSNTGSSTGSTASTTKPTTSTTTTTAPMGDPNCPHTNKTMQNVKAATCGQDGYDGDKVCSDCGRTLSSGQILPATGNHTFGDWSTVKEATAEENGIKERTCGVCGQKESVAIDALGGVVEAITTTTQVGSHDTTTTASSSLATTQPTANSASDEPASPLVPILVAVVVVVVIAGVVTVIVLVVKKKKNQATV